MNSSQFMITQDDFDKFNDNLIPESFNKNDSFSHFEHFNGNNSASNLNNQFKLSSGMNNPWNQNFTYDPSKPNNPNVISRRELPTVSFAKQRNNPLVHQDSWNPQPRVPVSANSKDANDFFAAAMETAVNNNESKYMLNPSVHKQPKTQQWQNVHKINSKVSPNIFSPQNLYSSNVINPNSISSISNKFAFKLNSLLKNNNSFVVSPFSIFSVLMLLYPGLTGKALKEIEYFLGISGQNVKELFMGLKRMMGSVNINNALFVDNAYANFISDGYRGFITGMGMIQPVNFKNNPERSRNMINGWIAKRTNNLIKELIPSGLINSGTVSTLVNTIYFKQNWKKQFDKSVTQVQWFKNQKGGQKHVEMMFQNGKHRYFEDDGMQLLEMDYITPSQNGAQEYVFSMGFVLQNRGFNIIDPSLYNVYAQETKVNVFIPKFKTKFKMEITPILKKLGITEIFNKNNTSFKKMFIKDNIPIFVSNIIHEAVIEVDEEGTEAAAATAMILMKSTSSSKPTPIFRANRTFQYYIKYNPTNTILFSGVFD